MRDYTVFVVVVYVAIWLGLTCAFMIEATYPGNSRKQRREGLVMAYSSIVWPISLVVLLFKIVLKTHKELYPKQGNTP